jgi:hypothetical protein
MIRRKRMQRALVIPLTPVIDTLVADLASALAYDPVWPEAYDTPATAVERLAPVIVLVDVDHPAGRDPHLILAAQRMRAAVLLYSAAHRAEELRQLAQPHGLGYFLLPNGPRALAAAIGEARSAMEASRAENEAARVARWTRLAAHHQARVSWHEAIMTRVTAEVQLASLSRVVVATQRESAQLAREAARDAREQLRAEVTQYVRHLMARDVPKRELLSLVGGVVHEALDPSLTPRDASALEAQVEQWCMEAYDSAA